MKIDALNLQFADKGRLNFKVVIKDKVQRAKLKATAENKCTGVTIITK